MQRTITLKAGIPTPIDVRGRQFVALSWSVETVTRFTMRAKAGIVQEFETSRRFDVTLPDEFEQTMVTATVDTVLEFIISDGTVRFDFVDGIRVRATIEGQPINVVNDRGSPANPLYVSGITYSDAPATAASGAAPVAVGAGITTIFATNAACKSIRFINLGPDPVAISPDAGLSWANRSIVLEVGDMWIEDKAPNLQWYGICDAGKTASIGRSRVLA